MSLKKGDSMGRNPGGYYMPPGGSGDYRKPTEYQLAVKSVDENRGWFKQTGINIDVYGNTGLSRFRYNIFYLNHEDIVNNNPSNKRKMYWPIELKLKKVWDVIELMEIVVNDYGVFLEKLNVEKTDEVQTLW